MEQNQNSGGSLSHPGSMGQPIGQKRNHPAILQKKEEFEKKRALFQSFWSSLSPDNQSGFLRIRIQDLRHHLITTNSSSCESLIQNFEEAIAHGITNQENMNCWRFWLCSHCDDSLLITDAKTLGKHMVEHQPSSPRLSRIDKVNDKWVQLVVNGTWKPVYVPEALKLLEDDSIEWPLCHDNHSERATLLTRIHDMFRKLQDNNSLANSNLETVMSYANRELKKIVPMEQQRRRLRTLIAETHLSICFLDVSQLNKILAFLRSLSDSCDLVEGLVDFDGTFKHALSEGQNMEIHETVGFNDDNTCLVLSCPRGSGEFIPWLFSGLSIEQDNEIWTYLKSNKKRLVAQFVQVYTRARELLHSWSKKRLELMNVEEIFRRIEKFCSLEDEMRKKDPEYAPKNYESLLEKRLEEIQDSVDEMTILEFQNIDSILNDSRKLLLDEKFEFEPDSACMKPWLPDMESVAFFGRKDASVKSCLKRKLTEVIEQRNQLEARIVRTSYVIKGFADRLRKASALDFRVFLLPLLRSFIRENMEKRMQRDAGGNSSSGGAPPERDL